MIKAVIVFMVVMKLVGLIWAAYMLLRRPRQGG